MWNIDFIQLKKTVQCPCFLALNSNGWADFVSNPVLCFIIKTMISQDRFGQIHLIIEASVAHHNKYYILPWFLLHPPPKKKESPCFFNLIFKKMGRNFFGQFSCTFYPCMLSHCKVWQSPRGNRVVAH